VGEKALKRFSPATTVAVIISAFLTGFIFHVLYQRWTSPMDMEETAPALSSFSPKGAAGPQSYRVTSPVTDPAELPLLQARDVERIRGLAGKQARIRGRVFRIGQSTKSNTYFLNFGPSREALTAVIFASAAELFEKKKMPPKIFDGKEVELQGEIKDHPQYGLEIILENPSQIKVID
jgi:hypothetical protein